MEHIPWWIDQIEVVLTLVIGAIGLTWRFGHLFGVLSAKVGSGFAQNHEDHGKIISKLDDHSERLSKVEVKVDDHRTRYP